MNMKNLHFHNCTVIMGTTVCKGANFHVGQPEFKTTKTNDNQLPTVFQSEEAQALLLKAQEAKLVDEQLQILISKPKAALLANEIADHLKLNPRWSPFEDLWNCKNLRNSYQQALESSSSSSFIDTLKAIFK